MRRSVIPLLLASALGACRHRTRGSASWSPPPRLTLGAWVDISVTPLPACRIISVAFRTVTDGWVVDSCGHVLRTRDGGRSFSFLERSDAPFVADGVPEPRSGHVPSDRGATHLVWLSANRGIAFGWHKSFATDDAGAHWTALSTAPANAVLATAMRGREWWACTTHGIARSEDAGTTWSAIPQPFDRLCRTVVLADGVVVADDYDENAFSWSDLTQRWTAVAPAGDLRQSPWGDGTVAYDSRSLTFIRRGEVVQRVTLRARGTNERESILGITARDDGGHAIGWTRHAVIQSIDHGRTWQTIRRFERAITHVSFDGHGVRVIGDGWDDEWGYKAPTRTTESTDLDATAWVAQTDAGRAREINPLRCPTSSATGFLAVFAYGGGSYGWFKRWQLTWSATSTELDVWGSQYPINRHQFGTLVNTIAATAEMRPEAFGAYHTSGLTLRWHCAGSRERSIYLSDISDGRRAGEIVRALKALTPDDEP